MFEGQSKSTRPSYIVDSKAREPGNVPRGLSVWARRVLQSPGAFPSLTHWETASTHRPVSIDRFGGERWPGRGLEYVGGDIGRGLKFEILLLPSERVESGETGEYRCKSMRGRGGVTGGDGLFINIDDEFLLVYCLPAKQVHADEAMSGGLDLNSGFGDGGSVRLVLLGRLNETVPALLVVLLQVPQRMGLGRPVNTVERTESSTGRSDGLEESGSSLGE